VAHLRLCFSSPTAAEGARSLERPSSLMAQRWRLCTAIGPVTFKPRRILGPDEGPGWNWTNRNWRPWVVKDLRPDLGVT
jgi:hypothetical protein